MKVQFVVVLLATLGLALSLPAKKEELTTEKDLNKEVDFVPLNGKGFDGFPPGGVLDIDAGSFFDDKHFGRNPFATAFNGVEAAFARVHRLLNDLIGRVPAEPSDIPDFPELRIPNFGNVDLGKGNTTSVTKIINGHKVTINDTEYKSDEANGSSYFKVHIVEVHPDIEESSTKKNNETVSPPKAEPESIETNEIPKIKDNEGSKLDDNIETFDQADEGVQPQSSKFTDIENFDDNRIDSAPPKPYDLSRDTYVNQLLADSGATIDPDAEVFGSLGGQIPSGQYYPEVRAAPSVVAPYNFYPGNMQQRRENQMQPFRNPNFYAPSMIPANNPYYNRLQPEQIMVVPLNSNPQSYYAPIPIQTTSSLSQGANPNIQTVLSPTYSNTTPDKMSSAPSTT